MSAPSNSEEKDFSWQKWFRLIGKYFFESDEKLYAWTMLFGVLLCVLGFVAMMVVINWWVAAFMVIFQAQKLVPFLIALGEFCLIISGLIGLNALKSYLIGKLGIAWRKWLTDNLLTNYFRNNNFLELKRLHPEIDNIGQRIQEDIKSFVELSLNLGSELLRSVLSLGLFSATLWVVGGALSFALLGLNIVIPGYLVWVAIIASLIASAMTHYIGKSLAKTDQAVERADADYRELLIKVGENAENIPQEHAENYYRNKLDSKMEEVNKSNATKIVTQTKLVSFQSFSEQFSFILPYLAAAPLYFTGLMELAQIMQVTMAFAQVSASLSWFASSYSSLSTYRSNVIRITELQDMYEQRDESATAVNKVARRVRAEIPGQNKSHINIKNLSLMSPGKDNPVPIIRAINLKLRPGESVVIKGDPGIGKSTLFKAISGSWESGSGKISLPVATSMCFLPQRPTIDDGCTLKQVLAYPDGVYEEHEYQAALKAVGGMEEFIPQLDKAQAWSKILSGGQQQRISFARALLKKPQWLFLDEATSALNESSEQQVYNSLKSLPNTTVVSIAHKDSVDKFHSKIVFFNSKNDKEIEVQEHVSAQKIPNNI